jgi:hypothetical protein
VKEAMNGEIHYKDAYIGLENNRWLGTDIFTKPSKEHIL